MKVIEALEAINKHAPYNLAYEWDNSGFLAGRKETVVKKILVALDFTEAVLDEAIDLGCNLIVTHHPYIFKGLTSITDENSVSGTLLRLIENGISLICAHTNLDRAAGGINDILCRKIGLTDISPLGETKDGVGEFLCGHWGKSLSELVTKTKRELDAVLRISIAEDKIINKIGVCSGSGCEFSEAAKLAGCDALLTADAKYHSFQHAAELGIILIDAGHFETENIVCPYLASMFGDTDVVISKAHRGFYKTI